MSSLWPLGHTNPRLAKSVTGHILRRQSQCGKIGCLSRGHLLVSEDTVSMGPLLTPGGWRPHHCLSPYKVQGRSTTESQASHASSAEMWRVPSSLLSSSCCLWSTVGHRCTAHGTIETSRLRVGSSSWNGDNFPDKRLGSLILLYHLTAFQMLPAELSSACCGLCPRVSHPFTPVMFYLWPVKALGGWRDGAAVKNPGFSSRGHGFNSQHLHVGHSCL